MHLRYRLLLFSLFTIFTLEEVENTAPKNCTVLLPRLHVFKRQILSRQQRGIIFPKKAFLLLSQAFTKAIIDGRPPGLSYSIEFDMYSPLPDTVEGWQPTILNQRLKSAELEKQKAEKLAAAAAAVAPTPPPTKNPNPMQIEDIAFPVDLASNPDFDAPPEDYLFDHQHHLEHDIDFDSHFSPRHWQPIPNITRKYDNIRQQQRQLMSNFYRQQAWQFSKTANSRRPSVHSSHDRPLFDEHDKINHWPPMEEAYESAAHVPAWKYHHGYRERRHLFEQMETLGKIFNFNMKACIQRAMCELRTNLRPYGESLIEDIVRIILTIPKKLKFQDDYSFDQLRQEQQPNCDKHFKHSCPYRVLDFLTATLRTATLDKQAHINGASGIVRKNTS